MRNTPEQNKAITTINKNISVNAGAGTGKTKVLTERFIHILEHGDLEEGKEVESIVAITFTKKATQEMKERIRKEIQKKSLYDKRWRRYYKDMEKANISTIHSFCGKLLRENPIEVNIDPLFTVLADHEGDRLLEETIGQVLLKGIEEEERVYNFIKLFKQDNLNSLIEDFKSIYYKVRTIGLSFQELKDKTLLTIDNIRLDLKELEYIKDTILYLMSVSRKNAKIYKLQEDSRWLKFLNNEYSQADLIPILEYLYDNIGTNKKEEETIEKLKETIEKVFLIQEKENKWVYDVALNLLMEIDREYSKEKEELGVLDYDDLQILTLKLLDNKSIREEYQNKFRYIMVDEFQDTNELQKQIFYKLCSREGKLDRENLFIVGDPKQSIYGFRGANVDVFYDVMADMEEVSGEKPIYLKKNFRTVNTVLDMVNELFGKLMGEKYTPLDSYHVSNNPIDVEILENQDLEIPDHLGAGDYNSYYESRLIASRIKELVRTGEYNYRDFALLFRSTTMDYLYEEALMEYNIPYYNVSGKGFFNRQEIIDIINALKAISNRYDTIAYIGFLRSPLVGLSDKSIYWLLRFKDDNLYKTLGKDIAYIGKEDREKIRQVKEILEDLMVKKDLLGVYNILNETLEKFYLEETLLMKEGGRQALANIHKFLNIAREFHREESTSLVDFLDYIEEIKTSEESQAKIETEDANVVKLMTIHKSKGLQFPVVVLPQMARGFNYNLPNILFHKDKGIGIKYADKSPLYKAIRKDYRGRDEEENKRILYVAMTRAEKRLLVGNQGRSSGFKRMIKDLINFNKVVKIESINKSEEKTKGIKLLEEGGVKRVGPYSKDYPLMVTIPSYGKKTFNSFNISQFLDFRQCARQFYMKYYKRLAFGDREEIISPGSLEKPRPMLDPISKGNLVHAFTEHYNTKIDPIGLLEKLVTSFGIEFNERIQEELMPYIKNYINFHREDYDKIYIEKEFYLKVNGEIVRGKIDRINIKNNRGEIIDFKTNRVDNMDELINYYSPQLQFYTLVVEEIMNIKIDRAKLLFLETGEEVEVDIKPNKLEEVYREVEDFIKTVKSNSSIDKYEKRDKCKKYCDYTLICNGI